MPIVVGVDEAGLGPILGPLVVSAVAVEVPGDVSAAGDPAATTSLWELLEPAVGRAGDRRPGVVQVDDSKRLYSGLRGPGGLGRLELGVLAFLEAGSYSSGSLSALLEAVAPGTVAGARRYPWYRDADLDLPRSCSRELVQAAAGRVAGAMRRAGATLRAVRSEVVLAGELNRLLDEHPSKSDVLLEVTARHLRRCLDAWPESRLVIHLDRQGARIRYLPGLQRVLADEWIWVEAETRETSRYRIERQGAPVELDLTVGCESRHLPVALASMVCKYIRELMLVLLNRYWAVEVPGLAPTAGYARDGRRFLVDIGARLDELGLDRDLLVRRR
jgi:hypothetical protein